MTTVVLSRIRRTLEKYYGDGGGGLSTILSSQANGIVLGDGGGGLALWSWGRGLSTILSAE